MKNYNYERYLVKVVQNGMDMIVKSNVDIYSYDSMYGLYQETINKISQGEILFIGANGRYQEVIYSTTAVEKEDVLDEMAIEENISDVDADDEQIKKILDDLVNSLSWIQEYYNKSDKLKSSMDMSRDIELKKIELFDNLIYSNVEESNLDKIKIFDSLQKILKLRRQNKYNTIVVGKIASRLDIANILTVVKSSIESASNNSSVNITSSSIVKHEEHKIEEDIFDMNSIDKIVSTMDKYDKVYVNEDAIVAYNKDNQNYGYRKKTYARNNKNYGYNNRNHNYNKKY